MKFTSFTSSFAVIATMAFALPACSDDATPNKTDTGGDGGAGGEANVQVEIFSWWSAPGEKEALESLINLHDKKYPDAPIYNAAADPKIQSGGVEAKDVLKDRLLKKHPPDSFQTNAFELHVGYFAENPGLVASLDDLYAEEKLTKAYPPEVIDQVTVDGSFVAVPVNAHRENSLFYNIQVFKDHKITPPTTIAEFLDACDKLKAAKVTPLAISTSQSWIIDKVFQAFALGTWGPEKYKSYIQDKDAMDEADVTAVIDLLDNVLTNYIDADTAAADGYGWTQAADDMQAGKAGMFIHGDWAKGYLQQAFGWEPDVDFGAIPAPDTGDAFIFGADVFAVPTGAPHMADALDWIRTIASPEGQVAFNEHKGSSPVRLGIDTTDVSDKAMVAAYESFQSTKYRLGPDGGPAAWSDGFAALAKDHDKAAMVKVIMDNPLMK